MAKEEDQVLELLLREKDYLSGETIAERLGVSRAAVWKRIRSLRKAGFVVEAQPKRGYRLLHCPDLLWPARIGQILDTEIIGREIVYFPVIDSTNLYAKKLATNGAAEGTLVIAEDQTRGRGRMGRSWLSPAGKSLLFSIILRPSLPPSEIFRLTILSAWAVARAIASQTPLTPQIKWPNDILLQGCKVGGILIEFAADPDQVIFAVVGIGLNVNFDPAAYAELSGMATSLAREIGQEVDRLGILAALLRELDRGYRILLEDPKEGFERIRAEWQASLAILGRQVRVICGEEVQEGLAEEVDEHGALILRDTEGKRRVIYTGDVSLRF
ncbi:MAG: biotin--[acetyl-CoA-carboxylase] ligase [Candidatus Tectomicrobia bacterium]|uniref:Bifunctional ligase/repressor BirA n=1 Tax=Tectimicrobiota bacterium TaxID=2528274 RepID=A0A932CPY7_UNCTE|nr:biotin--[acetyl-CoA-carboxylase] ligase [Candidatus Tectomicrobia bacterium]